ncbi:MAG: DUF3473 domain-containing protein [Ardenticatenia bacterium]|nr:MAG: DUF3473 domain-containing protein [Ardenticatenia bacterium]
MAQMTHMLTIDVEDWPQSTLNFDLPITERAADNMRRLLDLLRRHNVRATMFVQGMFAEAFPALVAEMAAEGHEIATHGYSHRPVYAIGAHRFADELTRSVALLEACTGQAVRGYRAPDFSVTAETPWAFDILKEAGLLYDSSIFPVRTPRYGMADKPRRIHMLDNGLWEVPLSTIEWGGRRWPVAGGGYFRLFPYALTRRALQRLEAEGMPAVVYLHPYELDPDEFASIPHHVPRRLRLSQGLGRRSVADKLSALLNDFTFAPIAEHLASLQPYSEVSA